MINKRKAVVSVGIVTAAVTAFMFLFSSANFKGMYCEGLVNQSWLLKQNTNSVTLYGLNTTITTTSGKDSIAKYLTSCKRAGIAEQFFPYSSLTQISRCSTYNAGVKDSSQFTGLVSEIEPYNDGDYAGFYSSIISSSKYCKATGKVSVVYMGWPSVECWDSIVKYTNVIFIHCYVSSTTIATGGGQYGYVRLRLGIIAASAKRYNKVQQIVIIYSCEPAFSYDYFKTHSWDDPLTNFNPYYQLHASSDMKTYLHIAGRQIYVSRYAKELHP